MIYWAVVCVCVCVCVCDVLCIYLILHNTKKIKTDCFKEKGNWNRNQTEIFWGVFVESFFKLWNQKKTWFGGGGGRVEESPRQMMSKTSTANPRRLHGDWPRVGRSLSSPSRPHVSKVSLSANEPLVGWYLVSPRLSSPSTLPLSLLSLVVNSPLVGWVLTSPLKRELLQIN